MRKRGRGVKGKLGFRELRLEEEPGKSVLRGREVCRFTGGYQGAVWRGLPGPSPLHPDAYSMDYLHHECGIAALYHLPGAGVSRLATPSGPERVSRLMPRLLLDLQNRGQL